MPTMTSTLHTNQFLEYSPFSTGLYGGPRDGRLHGAEQYASSGGFGNNIWQAQGQTSRRLNMESSRQVHSKPPALSLALPNIRAQPQPISLSGGKQSPGLNDRNDTRNIDLQSAQTRSQNSSAVLTPTSLTSPSDASQAGTSRHNSNTTHDSGNLPGGPGDGLYSWPTAKEFQPSSHNYGFDMGRVAASNGKNKATVFPGPGNGRRGPPPSIQAIWTSDADPLQQVAPPHVPQSNSLQSSMGNIVENGQDRFNLNLRAFRQEEQMSGLVKNVRELSLDQTRFDSEDWQMPATWQPRSESLRTISNGERNPFPNSQSNWTHATHPAKLLDRPDDIALRKPAQAGGIQSSAGILGASNKLHTYQASSIPVPYEMNLGDGYPTQARPEYYSVLNQYPTNIGLQRFNEPYIMNPDLSTDYRHHQPYPPLPATHYLPAESSGKGQHDSHHISRSALLEEFRQNGKTKKYELHEIFGHIVEFSGDQLGSRFIQHKLEVASSEEKEIVFQEISCDSRQLMTDVFGNYVIQKMFDNGNQTQKKVLANHMRGHVYALSTQTYGCRVVQKALEHILTDQQAVLVRELDGNVLKVVENQNGNHVIQKAIECVPGEHIQFIVDAHRNHVHRLSKHPYGCRVIQRMLEHCQPRAKRQILDELHLDIADLIQDPFGNYVVQHVIVKGEAQDRKPVIDKVQSRLMENAMHKFASNVVEKALDYADKEQRESMLRRLTASDEHGQSQVSKMLNHQYGNYVIQRCAAHLGGHDLYNLIGEMEQYLTQLRRVSTGKQVTALENSIHDACNRLRSQHSEHPTSRIPTQPTRTMLRR